MPRTHMDCAKTATDQSFGGRRVKLGMLAIIADYNGSGMLVPAPGMCVGFEDDRPRFQTQISPGAPAVLEFVSTEAELCLGKWTWPERV
jgi:hypothetical protein